VYVHRVDSSALTAVQIADLVRQVARHRAYCGRLRARCVELNFPDDDPFHAAVRRAQEGVEGLARLLGDLEARANPPTWAGGTRPHEPKKHGRRRRGMTGP
jgi:hypothetical protein